MGPCGWQDDARMIELNKKNSHLCIPSRRMHTFRMMLGWRKMQYAKCRMTPGWRLPAI